MASIATILASTRNPFFCLREQPSMRSRYLDPCRRRWIPRSIRACLPSDRVGGDGGISASAKRLHFGKEFLSFASDNFLPLALVSGVGLGFANPSLGCLADKYSLSRFSTCGIFIISGLTLRTEAIGAAVKGWRLGVFGLVSILLLTPSFSRLIMLVQLQPRELVTDSNLGIKVIRESFKGFASFVDSNRKLFSKINAICLSLVPWIQVSRSRSLLLSVEPKVFLAAVGIGILLHLSLLAFNAVSIRILSAVSGDGSKKNSKENATAVLLVASQKTLPVMVAVVEQLRGAFGESGLLVLPCVAAHLNQIMIDSILVNLWLRKGNVTPTDVKTA